MLPTRDRVLASILLLAAPVLAFAGCGAPTRPEPIRVGHLAPLSGPRKAQGEQEQRGIQLAILEMKDPARQIDKRTVAVLHADTQGDPDRVAAAATRLLAVSQAVGFLGGVEARNAERLARAVQAGGVAAVTTSALAAPFPDNLFSANASPASYGQTLARYTVDELKSQRVYVVRKKQPPSAPAPADAYVRALQEAKVVVEEGSYEADKEFPELVGRLVKFRPGAVLIAAPADDFAALRTRIRQAGGAVPLLYGGAEADEVLAADGAGDAQVFLATPYIAEAGAAFARAYEERYRKPPTARAALAYDGARLLIEAMRLAKAGPLGRVKEELAQLSKVEGSTGPLAMQPDRHTQRPLFLVTPTGGAPKLVKRYDP